MQNGKYKFSIKNETDDNTLYDIKFIDEANLFVNIKYKLKIDNIYIIGNEEKYVGIEELEIKDIIVQKGSNNVFTLEWYWEDDDILDTKVASQDEKQTYTLKLEVNARPYEE